MQLIRDTDEKILQVRSCEPGVVIVGESRITSHLLLSPSRLDPEWPVSSVARLRPEDFLKVTRMQPDLVLLGTGRHLRFPAPLINATLLEKGIGFEVMDSKAACRTFNILALEGRSVVAAILQISTE